MKYAIVNGNKEEATPGAKGKCIFCDSEMIAYCGEIRTYHWKHKDVKNCDSWFEPETNWHRDWKNLFKTEYQEYIFHNTKTKEKHIADVYNIKTGVVIEFQHSPISPDEINSRELFYKKMIWVVDILPYKPNIFFEKNNYENFKKFIIEPWVKKYYRNKKK